MNFFNFSLQSDFNSRPRPIATPSLHVPTTNQVACSPPRTATSSGNINSYDMGWRVASRTVCPATAARIFASYTERCATAVCRIRRSSLLVVPRGHPELGFLEALPSLDHCSQ
ncbi:hypothetical protein TNCV_2081111 [Trichonephila clavipes]|nr:hypothetical protein TNCV_2081111 [Trichonephila clavipes]